MTIAIALKLGDGLVLGADSASTLGTQDGVVNVYFNAEKIINLHKGLPIGAVTYGLGNIDRRSTTSLAKELRERLMGSDPTWALDRRTYTMEEVAARVKHFFRDEYYEKEYPKKRRDAQGKVHDVYAEMGFIVAGYSAGQRQAEAYTVEIDSSGECTVSSALDINTYGVLAKGQPEIVLRLLNGWSPRIYQLMVAAGIDASEAMELLTTLPKERIVQPYMPIQDGIDLVRYLIQVTEGYVRFAPGAPTVHEPIDLAAITYHEGFRWVQRKLYYSPALNPPAAIGALVASRSNT